MLTTAGVNITLGCFDCVYLENLADWFDFFCVIVFRYLDQVFVKHLRGLQVLSDV